jgi:CheY-like chemotaxis protein
MSPEIVPDAPEEVTNSDNRENDSKGDLKNIRVLVVDDDDDTREMMVYVLNHWEAQTQASASVAEALVLLANWQPDIILADLSMPEEDGYSLLRKIRTHNSEIYANTPVIALTAHAHPEESKRALSAGFQLHMTKPVDVQTLAEAIINLTAKPVEVSS